VVLDDGIAGALADMMSATVTKGTAREGFHDKRGRPYFKDVAIAGKTGSLTQGDPYRAFSWFVGFAPISSPRVIVSVLLGNGEKWHLKAHTAARMVLESAL
jgi:cell division protein FtsI/penicillin-binding protein 2